MLNELFTLAELQNPIGFKLLLWMKAQELKNMELEAKILVLEGKLTKQQMQSIEQMQKHGQGLTHLVITSVCQAAGEMGR